MKIFCWNVNGIRACIKKGFWDWFETCGADVACLQETKITAADFQKIATEYDLTSLTSDQPELELAATPTIKRKKPLYYALATAQKPGYSGVAIFSWKKPKTVTVGLGKSEFDNEGRSLIADYGKFTLVNLYVPNGGEELKRIPYKVKFNDHLLKVLQKLRKTQKNLIICGDMNVAHEEIDIKNPKGNVNNSGFTKTERDWFTKFLSHDYVDIFRHNNPDLRDAYTWWSYRFNARKKNIGWRIDYFVITKEMTKKIKDTGIQPDQLGSDHCPIYLEL